MGRTTYLRVGVDATEAIAGAKAGKRGLKELKDEADKLSSGFDRLVGGFKKAKDWLFSLKGGFASLGLGIFLGQLVSATTGLERMVSAFAVATGGMGAARAELAFVRQVTQELGIALESSASAFAKFSASVKGTAVEGANARKVFRAVAEASSALGLSADDTNGILVAMSQLAGKGVASTEELRQQMGERLPGAFLLAARSMGMTVQSFGKALEQGQILSEDLLPKLADEMSRVFGEQAATGADRLQGRINALATAWFEFRVAIGEGGGADLLKSAFTGAASALNSLSQIIPTVANGLKILSGAAIGLVTALAVGKVLAFATAFETLTGALIAGSMSFALLQARVTAFTASLAANPIGLILTALGALVGLMFAAKGTMGDLYQAQTNLNAVQERWLRLLGDAEEAEAGAKDRAALLKAKVADLAGAISELQDLVDDSTHGWGLFVAMLSGARGVTGEARSAMDELIGSLRAAREELLQTRIDEYFTRVTAKEEELADVLGKVAELETKLAKERAEAAEKLEADALRVLGAHNRTAASIRELGRDMVDLTTHFNAGRISATAYAGALEEIGRKADALAEKLPEIRTPDFELDLGRDPNSILGSKQLDIEGYKKGQDLYDQMRQGWEDAIRAGGEDVDVSLGAFFAHENKVVNETFKKDVKGLLEWTEFQVVDLGKQAFAEFASGGKVTWDEMLRYFARTFASMLAELVKIWIKKELQQTAITKAEAVKRQALNAGEGGGGFMAKMGGATGMAALGAFAIGLGAILKMSSDNKKGRAFATSGSVDFDGGLLTSKGSGKFGRGTGQAVADGIKNLVEGIIAATNSSVISMDDALVRISNNKKAFEVKIGETVVGRFGTAEEAVLEAAKAMFRSAELEEALTRPVQELLSGFKGSAEELADAVGRVREIEDFIAGVTSMEQAIKSVRVEVSAMERELVALGLSARTAREMSMEYGVAMLRSQRDQITGRERPDSEILEEKKREALLWNAEKKLLELRIRARVAAIKAEMTVVKAEVEIDTTRLRTKADLLGYEARVLNTELGMHRDYLEGRAQVARNNAKILQAELDTLNTILAAMPVDIDLGEIRLPGKVNLGGLGGGTSKWEEITRRWEDTTKSLLEWLKDVKLNESTTALAPRDQVLEAKAQLDSILGRSLAGDVNAYEQLQGVADQFLRIYKDYTGGGSGFLGDFADIFAHYIEQIEQAAAGQPRRAKDQKVIFDERFHSNQKRQIQEQAAHREQDRQQLGDVNKLLTKMVDEQRKAREELSRLRPALYEFTDKAVTA